MRSTGVFTYEDYMQIGGEAQDYELIEGELVVSPSATPFHQKVMVQVCHLLRQYLESNPNRGDVFAETDVKLPGQSILRPDLAFVTKARLENGTVKLAENIQGPPDLVVEILSPSTSKRDRETKRRIYAEQGVLELWLVSLEAGTVQVVDLEKDHLETYGEGETVVSPLLDTTIQVASFFAA